MLQYTCTKQVYLPNRRILELEFYHIFLFFRDNIDYVADVSQLAIGIYDKLILKFNKYISKVVKMYIFAYLRTFNHHKGIQLQLYNFFREYMKILVYI